MKTEQITLQSSGHIQVTLCKKAKKLIRPDWNNLNQLVTCGEVDNLWLSILSVGAIHMIVILSIRVKRTYGTELLICLNRGLNYAGPKSW